MFHFPVQIPGTSWPFAIGKREKLVRAVVCCFENKTTLRWI